MNRRFNMKMIDVTEKPETRRKAMALARLLVEKDTIKLIKENRIEKGDPIAASKIVSLNALKIVPQLLPFCHPIRITGAKVDIELFDEGAVEIRSEVSCVDRTGAEMEALAACASAALNLYDMLKRYERWIKIVDLRILEKEGGKSGHVKLEHEFSGKVIFLGKSQTRGPKTKIDRIKLIEHFGVEGDIHAGTQKQVSVFPLEALARMPKEKFNFNIDELTENITIIGIPEYILLPGKKLKVGAAELEINEIGKEKLVDEGRPYAVSRWGRFCSVIKGGEVLLYDEVMVEL
ncbi:MAG TPA: cyclic pyranopterin monophosphate synthase MoaC [Candidatus Hydrothermia bacterium]|nr:cyclic pyranopterin monophosphate synthase MoaC [Candidatus Hydrothermia bacterium]MDD5573093.1 cyclic pyranopterin monophosphate synthase MoaC [Candidatus Hydrothermia bacterium]HOK23259.1 cyclic pyranopterin monophosphate synthase MoaC [Candidatus Hydrothermia bacterium]HOL24068.1 cyclic pyranopterin monophosphate synthase MoaC [Candidatus Hydrothermia bacterium]HOP33058.1 cyclic pyranopterin monophosphate synthase MoaC [Candidatus Hydrothermia bacterium]